MGDIASSSSMVSSRALARLSEGALNYVITNKRLASFGLVSMYDYYTERFVKC